jgi:predicted glycogen debranching enzyme
MFDFGREVCGFLPAAEKREWLVTNGIGGFAMGTVAGLPTRRYHGLLVAALKPPLGRTLLLAKLDETVSYDGRDYPLYANRWVDGVNRLVDGVEEPDGYRHLERFHLEGTTPVWTYTFGDGLLEKRLWMEPGANTTYVQYHLRRASAGPVALSINAMANYRDYHATTIAADCPLEATPLPRGLRITRADAGIPYFVLSDRARATAQHEWYEDYFLAIEEYRGQNDVVDDLLYAGLFTARLEAGERLTLVATTDPGAGLDGDAAFQRRQRYEEELLRLAPLPGAGSAVEAAVRQLVLAADQFIVRRATAADPDGRTIIAGYPWFSDWGRDTMISLPGLTLATGRPDVAARILRTFARFVDQGMLPNRFPDEGEAPEYNTVDATLWYFEAVRAYHAATGDDGLARELFPILVDIVDWHVRGTRFHIHLDPADGLIYAGEAGVQLTWMDAKVGDWVVTPRCGKPVEINALWYNALRIMAHFARHLSVAGPGRAYYHNLAEQAQQGFQRFWRSPDGPCYDVLDGPDGPDVALRPNQLLAVALPYSPLTAAQQQVVVDLCARRLLTSHGLRTLSADDPHYLGHYGGNQKQRDAAYHQGTVWSWLMGPFVAAHGRVYADADLARSYLRPLLQQLAGHGVGSISEIFDGDPPFTPRGCPAQAWGVAELLRLWYLFPNYFFPNEPN